ncbi:MAG: hypothetical protein ACLTZT_09425 [Butyricimonas faecalis]
MMLRIVVNVLLLVGISLGVKAQEKGVAYELKLILFLFLENDSEKYRDSEDSFGYGRVAR